MRYIKKSIVFFPVLLPVLFFVYASSADPKFGWPLNLPKFLTATLGETRGSHLHQGIDIKTNGRAGYPVFAPASGRLSRIISKESGYGNALFLDHGNGIRTVYGHLDSFEQKKHRLDDIVKTIKNLYSSDNLDFSFRESKPFFDKDEMIALTGESGSGLPHLHFEIRENDRYANPLDYIHVKDRAAPVIAGLWLCVENENTTVFEEKTGVKGKRGIFATDAPVSVPKAIDGRVFFKVSCYDNAGSFNKLAVYRIQVFEENEKIFEFAFDYLNAGDIPLGGFIYDKSKSSIKDGVSYAYNLRRQKANSFSGFKASGNGYPSLKKKNSNIKIIVSDFSGNEAALKFSVLKSVGSRIYSEGYSAVDEKTENNIQNGDENIKMIIPKGALGMDSLVKIDESQDAGISERLNKECGIKNENIIRIFSIYPHDAVYSKPFRIAVKEKISGDDTARVSLYQFFEGRKPSLLKTDYSSIFHVFQAESYSNGHFALIIDDTPPEISIPPTFQFCEDRDIYRKLRFFVKDDLSKVNTDATGCYIDGEKFAFKFDPDRNWIEVMLTRKFLAEGLHHVFIKTCDNAGNNAVFRDLILF